MQRILISPHNDDAVLFAAFTLCKYRDMKVITVFDSFVQQGNPRLFSDEVWAVGSCERRREDRKAIAHLIGPGMVEFAGLRDDTTYSFPDIFAAIDIAAGKPDWTQVELWHPGYEEGGHAQHNAVAQACAGVKIRHRYATYVRGQGRTVTDKPVTPEPEWILRKLKALACYESQITIGALGCWPWFMDLREFEL